MKLRSLVAAFVLACVCHPAPASASGIDLWEFLNDLSGPGPFYGFTIHARLLCVARGSDVPRPPGTPVAPGKDPIYTPKMIPFEDLFRNPKLDDIENQSDVKTAAKLACLADRGVRAHLNGYYKHLESVANNVQPIPVGAGGEDFDNVTIHDIGVEYALRLDGTVDIGTRIGVAHFKGPAFSSFRRISFDYVNARIYPLAAWGDGAKYRSLAIFFAASGFGGDFDRTDFCSTGSCSGSQPYDGTREVLWRVGMEIDVAGLVNLARGR